MVTTRIAAVFFAAGAAVVLAAPGLSAKRQPCSGGRFLVQGLPLVVGGGTLQANTVIMTEGEVALGTVCAPKRVRLKARKKFTRVIGKWRSCSGVIGRVKLKARIDAATCNRMTGRFRAGKPKSTVFFDAVRSECGDGFLDTMGAEQCDDGNRMAGDGCSSSCVVEHCGDGIVSDGNEECEPPGTDACQDDCTLRTPVCGDGFVTPPEVCDDGNTTGGDGCSSTCDSQGDPSGALVDADGDGEADDGDACPNTPPGAEVDGVGCSQQQFCSSVDATTRSGKRTCRHSDWRNDEPIMRGSDRDCAVARGRRGRSDDRCVANLR